MECLQPHPTGTIERRGAHPGAAPGRFLHQPHGQVGHRRRRAPLDGAQQGHPLHPSTWLLRASCASSPGAVQKEPLRALLPLAQRFPLASWQLSSGRESSRRRDSHRSSRRRTAPRALGELVVGGGGFHAAGLQDHAIAQVAPQLRLPGEGEQPVAGDVGAEGEGQAEALAIAEARLAEEPARLGGVVGRPGFGIGARQAGGHELGAGGARSPRLTRRLRVCRSRLRAMACRRVGLSSGGWSVSSERKPIESAGPRASCSRPRWASRCRAWAWSISSPLERRTSTSPLRRAPKRAVGVAQRHQIDAVVRRWLSQ